MKRYSARTHVDAGFYFEPRQFRFRSVETPGPLPGVPGERYVRVPTWAMLLGAPWLGLAFVVFLPLIGLLMVAGILVRALARWTTDAAVAFGRVSRPAWRPVTAFLGRTRRDRRGKRHPDQWSERVKKTVADDGPEA